MENRGGEILINILIYGRDDTDELETTMIGALANNGGVQYYSGGVLSAFTSETPRYNLYISDRPINIGIKNGIVVLHACMEGDIPITIPEGVACIVDSSNTLALSMLKNAGHIAYCCGTSPRDTFSISSLESESAVVSVLRQVESIQGDVIEPCEIPITFASAIPPFNLLACCAVLAISGQDISQGISL